MNLTCPQESSATLEIPCSSIRNMREDWSFLAVLGHDLRTPLNGVRGFLELLDHTALDSKQQDYLKMAADCAGTLQAMLDRLLDGAKRDADQVILREGTANLIDLLRQSVEISRLQAKGNSIGFHLIISPNMPAWWLLDAAKLRQILLNLLSNAVKFTVNGSVTLEATTIPKKRGNRQGICLTIKDSGVGIPKEQLGHVFDAFYQAENSATKEGSGLGLALVKKLVATLNGSLHISSQVGQGTTVSLEFFWMESSRPQAEQPLA